MKATQRDRVLQYLKQFGSITRRDAFVELGIVELPARIVELRRQGYRFDVETESGKNRYGDPIHWARYTLEA